mgnify:CR=1 FL=1
MPDITFPYSSLTTPGIVDGEVADGDRISRNFYSPTHAPESLEVVNGRLGKSNRAPGWKVNTTQIQSGALSGAKSVGATLNLDFFPEIFQGWTWDGEQQSLATNPSRFMQMYVPIPGANAEFYLPFTPSLVVFSWSISTAVDDNAWAGLANQNDVASAQTVKQARLRLFVNGTRVNQQVRYIPQSFTAWERTLGTTTDTNGRKGWLWDRYWVGNHMITDPASRGLTQGWHSAGVRLATEMRQMRVRVRSFDYVFFR